MSSASSIAVTVRVRPFSIREAAQLTKVDDAPSFFGDGSLAGTRTPTIMGKGVRRVIKVVDDTMLVFDPPEDNPMARYQKTILPQGKRVKDMRFGFDRVFDENCTQQDVYEATTRPLLDSVLDGFNATVFAYGATGCGKTHTISGNPQNPGIIFLTCAELFERINALKDEKDIDLSLSYLEIYNETIRDLLVPGGSQNGLQLREDTRSNIAVSGLSMHAPQNVQQVMDMIVMGNANRTMSPTEANATSSRSHAVLQINVTQKPRTAGLSEDHMCATLSIIDLAGSERASVTKNRGARLLEGANINRSLLALGNCINALCDPTRKNHVPYRDSKLTRLLKFSLGGNCKTVMIVCVSPGSQHYDETHNTLKYANRAKNIKTKVSRNMINVNRHVSQYVKAIYDLRQEVDELKKRLDNTTKEAMQKINKQNSAKEAAIKEGLRRLRVTYEQSKDARKERANDLISLRVIERRKSSVRAWSTAFDEILAERQQEEPPASLFKMRAEADKVVQELDSNHAYITQKLEGPSWEKIIDSALQGGLKNLSAIEGVQESDAAVLTTEANLLRTAAERDILNAVVEADLDISVQIHTLAKAHFETVVMVNKVLDANMAEEEALEKARKSLFDIQQAAGDAASHIVRPGGELVSSERYQPPSYVSPRKKNKAVMSSPLKLPAPSMSLGQLQSGPLSPMRASPARFHKPKSPKKALKFAKKSPSKKRVRFQEDMEDVYPTDDVKPRAPSSSDDARTRTYAASPPPPAVRPMAVDTTTTEREADSPPADAPSGLAIAPIRPKTNRFEAGFLSKNRTSPPPNAGAGSAAGSEQSPLRGLDSVDQVLNRLKGDEHEGPASDPETSTNRHQRAWPRNQQGPSPPPPRSHLHSLNPHPLRKAAMRKSSTGFRTQPHHNHHPHPKRRSPTASANSSPEMAAQSSATRWTAGQARRMPAREKENAAAFLSHNVLGPSQNAGVKRERDNRSGRRQTISGAGGMRLSSLALAGLKEQMGPIRDSINAAGKAAWR